MLIRFSIRNYPLSPKLSVLNSLLLIVDLFVSGAIFAVIFTIFGGVYAERTDIQNGILIVVPIISFLILKAIINRITDKKYDIVVEEYKKKLANLTPENPEEVKDKILRYPATLKFTRAKLNQGKLFKQKFFINDVEYNLSNGQTIDIAINKALNTIEVKNKFNKDIKYFTVSDNEKLEITYSGYAFNNIERE